jgi:hypothetical protein
MATWEGLAGIVLLLAVVAGGGCSRAGPVRTSSEGDSAGAAAHRSPLFHEVTREVGLDFQQQLEPPGSFFFPEINGTGAAFVDFDRDGRLDILLVNFGIGYLPATSQAATAARPTTRLYHQTAAGHFVDVTETSGLGDTGIGIGVAVGDINNDGYPDVYLTKYGPDRLFLNLGDGRFDDITAAAGIDNPRWGTSACFFDFDRDGWLDLYVANYVDYHPRKCTRRGGGDEDYCGPHMFPYVAHKLYRNDSGRQDAANGRHRVCFTDVSLASQIARQRAPGMGVVPADFNGDGWPDLYVANDQTASFLWINQHDGTFRDEAVAYGCAYDAAGKTRANMGIGLGDLDGDGRLDLFVTNLDGERNLIYRNDAPGVFREASAESGMGDASLTYTGFGTVLADLDHDGDLDVVLVNGAVRRPLTPRAAFQPHPSVPAFWRPYAEPNQIFLSDGGGRFRGFLCDREPFTSTVEVSRGLAVGDVDNDGDLDLLVTNVAGPARLYFNIAKREGRWLEIQAVLPCCGGRDDYGALVTVTAGSRQWTSLLQPAYSYLCSNDPRVHLGLGLTDRVDRVEVQWSDGTREAFPGGPVDRLLILEKGKGATP